VIYISDGAQRNTTALRAHRRNTKIMYAQQQQTLRPLIRQHPEDELGEAKKQRLLANTKQPAKGNYSVVKVSVEVRNGAARFRVGVQASSIQSALTLVKGIHSTNDVKVVFPIDPEDFFVTDALAAKGLIHRSNSQEQKEELAA
jgi:hypothetical protein